MAGKKPDLSKLLERERADRRLRLSWFLREHYDELAAAKPDLNWPTFARVVQTAGAISARGRPPSVHAVRKAWLRLVEERQS